MRVVAGRYELEGELGKGGMGAVYAARHVTTRKRFALKLIHPSLAKDATARERFIREAQAPAEIDHPGIVDVVDAGVDPPSGSPFIVMELLDGKNFADVFEDDGVSLREGVELIEQALEPLVAAHARGFVHRDLKPENVFLARDRGGHRVVKLLDFGLVRNVDTQSITASGTTMGTPWYMSPEQWRNTREATPASDVWSVGVMLYQIAAGSLPFRGEALTDVMLSVCNDDPPHVADVAPTAPAGLSDVISRCLAKDPGRRPPDAAALLAELARVDWTTMAGRPSVADDEPTRVEDFAALQGMRTYDHDDATEVAEPSAMRADSEAEIPTRRYGRTPPRDGTADVPQPEPDSESRSPDRGISRRLWLLLAMSALAVGGLIGVGYRLTCTPTADAPPTRQFNGDGSAPSDL